MAKDEVTTQSTHPNVLATVENQEETVVEGVGESTHLNDGPFPADKEHTYDDGSPVIGYRYVAEPDQTGTPDGCHISISSGELVEDMPGALKAHAESEAKKASNSKSKE